MLQDQDLVSIQEVRQKVDAAWRAAQIYRAYTQDQVDAIVEAMAAAAREHAARLAELAVAETGYGRASDKLTKNLLACDILPRRLRGMRTVGVVNEIPERKLVEIAEPVGVVAAILPTTNPTSTAIYKTLISLKAGNAIVISPHPRARGCTCETAAILAAAARQAGAPEGLIGCVMNATMEGTTALMRHEKTSLILSTGGAGIVKAAYSSGKPAYGVGPGNVPVAIDASAEIGRAVREVVAGKSFDFGTVCSSEQTIIAARELREQITAELKRNRAYFCTPEQTKAVGRTVLTPKLGVNPECVGQSPQKIAKMAGFEVPEDATILVVEIEGVGPEHPLSAEKLSPVLSLYFVNDWAAVLDAAEKTLRMGGLGHTCVIHAEDPARIREYGLRMPAHRILVNTPSPQGSTGITTDVFPAMTLGCGAMAGNATGDNIGPQHLFHVKRIAMTVRTADQAFSAPPAARKDHSMSGAHPDRQEIVTAVERYLAQRGISLAQPAAQSTAAAVVDRFLANRRPATVAAVEATPAPAAAEAPKIDVVDFVCEDDVRQAMRKSQKIYIGRKTILTPSARDLGAQYDVLVSVE